MATPSEISTELRRILAAYPQHAAKLPAQSLTAMLEVWQSDLADLPADLLTMACRNHRERSQWLPSIAEIRASAVSLMRQASPAADDWNDAYAELQRQILRIGYTGIPEWSNPALAEYIVVGTITPDHHGAAPATSRTGARWATCSPQCTTNGASLPRPRRNSGESNSRWAAASSPAVANGLPSASR